MKEYLELLKKAEDARNYAYVPYSRFRVGAAVLTEKGEIYTGCNIENTSYGLTICAERTAIFKAVSEGAGKIIAIAISSDDMELTFPCGACRQVMAEFNGDMKIILGRSDGNLNVYDLKDLLPYSFKL